MKTNSFKKQAPGKKSGAVAVVVKKGKAAAGKRGRPKKEKAVPVRVVTPVGMLSYPYLVEPNDRGNYPDGKYKTDIIFDAETWETQGKALRKAVLQVARNYFGDATLKLSDFANPFKDGNAKAGKKEYNGCIYLTAKSDFQPTVVGPNTKPMPEERINKIKGGDFARLVVNIYPYAQQGGGVTVGLEVVQFSHEGEPLGEGRAASLELLDELEAELEDLEEGEGEEDDEEPKKKAAPKKPAAKPVTVEKKKPGRPKKKVEDDDDEEEDDDDVEESEDDTEYEASDEDEGGNGEDEDDDDDDTEEDDDLRI